MIQRLLVANRGEIARRVFATCRRLGIETVAVHSDADAGLPFVSEADRAVRLPGNAPADTYLRIDLVVEAALRSGADAIHPGYGFLSENADFARAVIEAGLTWVGPPPEAIEAMGDKVRAKEIAAKAGVPVLSAPDDPTEADLPLLVKASAGGGGRGMRVVRTLDRLDAEIAAARAEAESAFGDGTVFVEPYVEAGRHVEVQVWATVGGANVSVLGARDCSVQRRHQKVVEEAPPPGISDVTLGAMYDAARALSSAVGYEGVGTVEFLFDAGSDEDRAQETGEPGRFWFLEMNTRLQVEHPVTEAVLPGVDLVELQLDAADPDGGTMLALGGATAPEGHAVEVRLYAEDASYVPQSGRLVTFDLPADGAFEVLHRHGVRVDSGFSSGDEVSTHYDAMLAKVIAWAPSRRQAIRTLAAALRRARIHGVTTNRDQLVEILLDPVFAAGEMTTTWLESRPGSAESSSDSAARVRTAVVAGALMLAADDAARRTVQQGVPAAWRNVVSQAQRTAFEGHEPVEWWGTRDGFVVDGVAVLEVSPTHARLEVDGVVTQTRGHISSERPGAPREVWVDGPLLSARLREVPRFTDPADAVASGSLLAPMPGTVVAVKVEAGAEVAAGDVVLVLEAMKMQHTVTAPHDGTVTEINVEPGSQVASGEVLAVVEER
jgi:propionyl-CoA carboxylase alpha chain